MQQIHLIIENIREFIDKTTFIHGISKADLKNRH